MALVARDQKSPVRASLSKYGDTWVALAYRFDRNTNDRREFEFTDPIKASECFSQLLDPGSSLWKEAA